jgi:hypothetical protein
MLLSDLILPKDVVLEGSVCTCYGVVNALSELKYDNDSEV